MFINEATQRSIKLVSRPLPQAWSQQCYCRPNLGCGILKFLGEACRRKARREVTELLITLIP